MGSSDSGGGEQGLGDSSIGSIVWVRRRNGSWWPGKILGPDELSATHVMSPRSGTPVKLLGREDASVDWYNLEKSKRVKAFRCGDFDDCIERAEASQGMPPKKREKYARREDAILHALELEKQLLDKKYGSLGAASNSMNHNSSDSATKDLAISSGAFDNGSRNLGNHELSLVLKKTDSYTENECNSDSLYRNRAKTVAKLGFEHENSETSPRTRVLPDLGQRTALNKLTGPVSVSVYSRHRASVDDHVSAFSASSPSLRSSSTADSTIFVENRKRFLEGSHEEASAKRRGRRRPLVKLLQKSDKFSDHSLQHDNSLFSTTGEHSRDYSHGKKSRFLYMAAEVNDLANSNAGLDNQIETPVSHHGHGDFHSQRQVGPFTEETTSGSSEDTQSDSSETDSMERDDAEPDMTILSDTNANAEARSLAVNRLASPRQQENTSSEEPDVSSADDVPSFHFHDLAPSTMEVSKWQLKGKRNIRNLTRRPIDGANHGMYLEGRSWNQTVPRHNYIHDNDDYINEDFVDDDLGSRTDSFNRGYMPRLGGPSRRQHFLSHKLIDWEDLTWGGERPFRGYLDERGDYLSPAYVGRHGHSFLIDVDLKVQANHQGQHVPWVSLMSKLNGKAIIGHPIQIETLEDGSTDDLLSTADAFSYCGYDNDGNTVPSVWKTARRTANFRVPRPRPHSSPRISGDDPDYQSFDQDRKWQFKDSTAATFLRNKGLTKKSHSCVPRPPPPRAKKSLKKVSLSPSQKTRTLSSIGTYQKLSQRPRYLGSNYYSDGVIKPLVSGLPTVACIPVKLVFSRLLEAVGRPPSGPPPNHGVPMNSNKERNPS